MTGYLRRGCIVDGCTWVLDEPSGPTPGELADVVMRYPHPGTHRSVAAEIVAVRTADRERMLREHLETHEVVEWASTIARLRAALAASGTVTAVGHEREHPAARERAATSTTP